MRRDTTTRHNPRGTIARRALLGAGLGALACLGCGDGRPERVPVVGRVTIDGQPLKYGRVVFHVKDHRAAMAGLDEQGQFALSTYLKGDGCVLGEHEVSVNAGQVLTPTTRRWHAPPKYAAPATSGLSVAVSEDMQPVEINLSWDGGKPFIEKMAGGGD
jgi:hypothetical protein